MIWLFMFLFDENFWLIGLWISKTLYYCTTLCAVGSLWMCFKLKHIQQIQRDLNSYILICTALASFSSLSLIFCQLGFFSDHGVLGIFDVDLMHLFFSTHNGKVLLINLLCCSILTLNHCFRFNPSLRLQPLSTHPIQNLLSLLLLLIILFNYTQQGHSLEHARISSVLLCFHVLAVSLWMGALIPLYQLCHVLQGAELCKEIKDMSTQLAVALCGLMLCGLSLVWIFIPQLNDIVHSTYGQAILIKLAWVVIIFLLASLNRFYLSAKLHQATELKCFKWMLVIELSIALMICIITAYMTTFIGLSTA